MASTFHIEVKESGEELQALYKRTAPYLRPRLQMLRYMLKGVSTVGTLCARLGISAPTLKRWKTKYKEGGLSHLLSERRGGDMRSGITEAQKQKLHTKLSDPKAGFHSYNQARQWAKETLNIDKEYHAFNKYIKRNFGAKLKTGRKSHVQKSETATADYKKPRPKSATH